MSGDVGAARRPDMPDGYGDFELHRLGIDEPMPVESSFLLGGGEHLDFSRTWWAMPHLFCQQHGREHEARCIEEWEDYRRPGEVVPSVSGQADLFDERATARRRDLMATLDAINRRMGRDTVFDAGSGLRRGWAPPLPT